MRAVSRTYNPAMTAGDAGPAFSLEYRLRPDDLMDLYSTDDRLRTRRVRAAGGLALLAAAAITLIILTTTGVGTHGWYALPLRFGGAAVLGGMATACCQIIWRLAPSRLARLIWKKIPDLRGRHRDDIGPEGVTVTSPDGTQTFIPWSVIVSIRETSRGFVLRDRDGQVRVALPKRGLHDPALLPALGTYLREAVARIRRLPAPPEAQTG